MPRKGKSVLREAVLISFDTSVLLGYYQARTSGLNTSSLASVATSANGSRKYAPTAPWDPASASAKSSDLFKKVSGGQRFINEGANQLDLPGASEDYRKLFALYQGLNALSSVANAASAKNITSAELHRLQNVFGRGMDEVGAYAEALKLDQLRLTRGDVLDSAKSDVGVPKASSNYTTQTVFTGKVGDPVPAFEGAAKFTIQVTKAKVATTLDIDLSEMGSTPRTMSAVASFINGKLEAQGFRTRFNVERTAAEPRTLEVAGKTVKLPALGDAFAFKIKGDTTEALNFSAASTPAAYVVTKGGDPNPDDDTLTDDAVYESKLTKFDTATGKSAFSTALDKSVQTARKTITGPDGSLYMLADVEGEKLDGQTLKPGTDVALQKYDSAGNLVYSRTLGASGDVSGLSIALSADGKIAIAGAVKGDLNGATNGALNSTKASDKADSFATLFDDKGDEVWTVRRGALQEDEAQAVSFDASGNVLVAGRTKSQLPGATGALQGDWDSYVTSYSTTTNAVTKAVTPKANFTQIFGTSGSDGVGGMVVDNGVAYLAGVENGRGVVRSFNLSGSTATAGATRDLGDMQGGAIAGLAIEAGRLYVGGNTRNGALSVGGAGAAPAGGMDAFAARFSTNLADTSGDSLAYFGGTGNDTVTGMAVAGGQVWLTGVSGDAPSIKGGQDGYMAQLNMSSGAVVTSQKLQGKDGFATPTAIAVDTSGASVLDKFGLPKGTLDYTASQKVVSATAARPGDTIQLRSSDGRSLKTITLEANDTLETLATKIKRAAGFRAKVEVVSSGDVRKLKISPATATSTVEILAGKDGKDMLAALGLSEGVVRATKVEDGKTVPADGKAKIYGLKIGNDLDLSSPEAIKMAAAELQTALSSIRTIYRDLEAAAKPQLPGATSSGNGKTGGAVPGYLKNQISNYQAALDRLTGGG